MNGQKLRGQRMNIMDMTQQQLADALGVSQALISMMEAGKTPISWRTETALNLVRRDQVRLKHFRKACDLTGSTEIELEGIDVEAEIVEQDTAIEEEEEL